MVGWAPWAGRDIDVNGQDVQETRSRTYLRTLRHATRDEATRDWLSAVLKISVVMEFGRIGKFGRYHAQSTKFCRLSFWLTCIGDGIRYIWLTISGFKLVHSSLSVCRYLPSTALFLLRPPRMCQVRIGQVRVWQ